jgi:glutathione S-transferase
MALTFYFAPMSSSSRISWALEELGVPYEKVQLDVRNGDAKKADFLAINPHAKVPALVDGDAKIFESIAILLYLGERYGVEKKLWPGPDQIGLRGEAMAWSVWSAVELQQVVRQWLMNGTDAPFAFPKEKRSAHLAEVAAERWPREMAILEAHLKTRPFMLGDAFTFADLACVSTVSFGVGRAGLKITDFPHVSAWLARCIARPAHARIQ